MKEYLFFQKIKPGAEVWCIPLQTSVKFTKEVWIGVTARDYRDEVYFGHIFINGALGKEYMNEDIEFDLEKSQLEGNRYNTYDEVPEHKVLIPYTDIGFNVKEFTKYKNSLNNGN